VSFCFATLCDVKTYGGVKIQLLHASEMSLRQLRAVHALTAGKTAGSERRGEVTNFCCCRISSQYNDKAISTSAKASENNGEVGNQSRHTYSNRCYDGISLSACLKRLCV
jgi:hypothetical protein